MSTKKRNKKYRPRPVSLIGGIGAIAAQHDAAFMRQPMSDGQLTDLSLAFRLAFADMLAGRATEENWSMIACSLNIAVVLAERGYGEDCIPQINEALEGAFRAKLRAGRTGHWGFDGPAIQTIKNALEVHEAQLAAATKQELREVLLEVHRRIDEKNVFSEAA